MLVDNVDLASDGGWQFFREHCAISTRKRPPHLSRTSTPQELETYFHRAGYHDIRQAQIVHLVIVDGRKPLVA